MSSPELIYTDRDCCGAGGIKAMFPEWSDICVRLDIWHFMRRIASACTTESHPLYATFMGRFSQCIFEWSTEDLENLRIATSKDLGVEKDHPLVFQAISKKSLARHCCRRTRGVEKTATLLVELTTSSLATKAKILSVCRASHCMFARSRWCSIIHTNWDCGERFVCQNYHQIS